MSRMKQVGKSYPLILIALWVTGWYCFFQFRYSYHLFFQEQNQLFLFSSDYVSTYFEKPGGLAVLMGDFLTQFFYYRYAGAAILSFCLLLSGLLVYAALRHFSLKRPVALLASMATIAFVGVCHFSISYRLSSTIAIIGWLSLLWLVSFVGSKKIRVLTLLCALCPSWLLFGKPDIRQLGKPDMMLERNLAVDCEYYFGNHHRVIEMVESSGQLTDAMLFFYNLIQAQIGALPDYLLEFTPNVLGTFYKIGPDTPLLIIRNQNELYWLLGDMTFTERAAMMANVFSHNNRNVRMIKRLAECNVVSGDSLAAEKYLRILDKTLIYRQWADNVRTNGSRIYARKIHLVNHRDTITLSDNAHFLMTQLLDAHPDNGIALDYLLCSDLLLKDITTFKRDYDRYATGNAQPDRDVLQHRIHTTKLYQEALCIWLAGTNAPQEEWERYIHRPDVLQHFRAYNAQRGHPRFKDTYWYYFDKLKAPEV